MIRVVNEYTKQLTYTKTQGSFEFDCLFLIHVLFVVAQK